MNTLLKTTFAVAVIAAASTTTAFAGKTDGTGGVVGTPSVPVTVSTTTGGSLGSLAQVVANPAPAVAAIQADPTVALQVQAAATNVVANAGGVGSIVVTPAEASAIVQILNAIDASAPGGLNAQLRALRAALLAG